MSLSLEGNKLRSVPAALAQATALERCCLGGNSELALSAHDVDAVLLRLPCLADLELWGTATRPLCT